jgi:hypothetical protein
MKNFAKLALSITTHLFCQTSTVWLYYFFLKATDNMGASWYITMEIKRMNYDPQLRKHNTIRTLSLSPDNTTCQKKNTDFINLLELPQTHSNRSTCCLTSNSWNFVCLCERKHNRNKTHICAKWKYLCMYTGPARDTWMPPSRLTIWRCPRQANNLMPLKTNIL